MGMPKQVEQQLKEIEEMERQLQPTPEEPAEDTAQAEAPVQESEAPIAESTPVPPAEISDWEQRYRTLAGKYDAEVPRLHAQVKELSGQLQSLLQRAEQTAAPEPSVSSQLVTDQDREAFGEDLIDLQRRVAQEVASKYAKQFDAYESKMAALEQRLSQTGSQVGEMTFEQRLYRVVPDFEQVNNDPKWVAWLDEVDPILRAPRRVIAQRAYEQGDVEGVAHYVNLFRNGATPKQMNRQAELSRQVAPSRASGGTGQPAQQGKTYSMQQWSTLFDQVAMLNAQGKYDEGTKLEAELTAAISQGRVSA